MATGPAETLLDIAKRKRKSAREQRAQADIAYASAARCDAEAELYEAAYEKLTGHNPEGEDD